MADITNQQLLESLTSQFGIIANGLDTLATKDDVTELATKDDLKSYATKDDLKDLATKEDLKNYATKKDLKDELKIFVTKDDLKQTETNLEAKIDRLDRKISSNHTVNIKHHQETRAMIGDLNKKHDNYAKS